ncbi:hypothetical protein L596_021178 [Steinernema carpocapsae]|uniref:Uncharacterized protein n=1 Tax=Steinernema carpocapsae TaxID=34508 RepID=A0A4V6A1G0_STECR|nr:hypothetical protein L596_021178 [Steinernema carpocapsae]
MLFVSHSDSTFAHVVQLHFPALGVKASVVFTRHYGKTVSHHPANQDLVLPTQPFLATSANPNVTFLTHTTTNWHQLLS